MTRSGDARAAWNARYAARPPLREPARFLLDRAHLLPAGGRALDVAGGAGRHARWLADRGCEVTLVDVSDLALEAVRSERVTVVRSDVTVEGLPPGPFAVIVIHHFLDRHVWREAASHLGPGGVLLACQPTVRNLERHDRPSRRWLLDEGEAARLFGEVVTADDELELLECDEGWTADDRHEAQVVLRRADR